MKRQSLLGAVFFFVLFPKGYGILLWRFPNFGSLLDLSAGICYDDFPCLWGGLKVAQSCQIGVSRLSHGLLTFSRVLRCI